MGPADGSDRTRELSLGSAGRDQVLQHTVSGGMLARAAPHEERKKRSTVEASRQAISMLIAPRRQNGSNRRR